VPMPFTKVYYAIGTPMSVARDADDGAVEQARTTLERELARLTDEAERRARSG